MLIDIWFLLEAYWKWLLFNKWRLTFIARMSYNTGTCKQQFIYLFYLSNSCSTDCDSNTNKQKRNAVYFMTNRQTKRCVYHVSGHALSTVLTSRMRQTGEHVLSNVWQTSVLTLNTQPFCYQTHFNSKSYSNLFSKTWSPAQTTYTSIYNICDG